MSALIQVHMQFIYTNLANIRHGTSNLKYTIKSKLDFLLNFIIRGPTCLGIKKNQFKLIEMMIEARAFTKYVHTGTHTLRDENQHTSLFCQSLVTRALTVQKRVLFECSLSFSLAWFDYSHFSILTWVIYPIVVNVTSNRDLKFECVFFRFLT